MSRDNLLQRWNRQVEHLDNDPLEDPGKKPEKKLEPLAKKMRAAMSWYGEKWGPVKSELEEEYGLDWDRLLRTAPTMHSEDDEHGALIDYCAFVDSHTRISLRVCCLADLGIAAR